MTDEWLDPSDEGFDESEYPEPDEDDDAQDTVPCPNCGADVYEDAPACPVCGHYFTAEGSPWSGKPGWWILLGLLGVAAAIVVLAIR